MRRLEAYRKNGQGLACCYAVCEILRRLSDLDVNCAHSGEKIMFDQIKEWPPLKRAFFVAAMAAWVKAMLIVFTTRG
ncbi:hypothetical protein B0G75_114153 [Paraburkholderia sp. BL18I3N2]|uniref:hypothetical protein n=1 Tax=Paraburkholderia sp. BL18I3N2 TaxID=1938799 RepID=UPI000D06357B|nr:hypothetical protein [Paraburkholderia sp. BL18I3N2]PRX27642.1 hypothetical protein B0G75_114153 [Paraburkholderia sp. BL18I3N2]